MKQIYIRIYYIQFSFYHFKFTFENGKKKYFLKDPAIIKNRYYNF